MRSAAIAIVAFGIGLGCSGASAGFGPGASFAFTSAFVGQWSGGAIGTSPVAEPYPGFALPSLSGGTMLLPIPGGRHSAHWWRVFTVFQTQQAYALLSKAQSVAALGKAGVGTPGPVAGAGLPFLVAAGAAWLFRRRARPLAA